MKKQSTRDMVCYDLFMHFCDSNHERTLNRKKKIDIKKQKVIASW